MLLLAVSFYSTRNCKEIEIGIRNSTIVSEAEISKEAERVRSRKMNQNMSAFLIGMVGAAFTLGAYSQPWMTPTQSITTGLITLMFGLLVREGFISL